MKAAALAVIIAFGLAACGEADKTVVTYKKGEYQGKVDGLPWESSPNTWSGSTWEKGNKASWENAIKQRTVAQNEYARTQ